MTARAQKMPAARVQVERQMSEDDLLTAIVEAALFLGYAVHHDRRSDLARQQGTPGFPDLVLARRGVVWFIECKRQSVVFPTPDQYRWLHALPVESIAFCKRVVRPHDLDALLAELA